MVAAWLATCRGASRGVARADEPSGPSSPDARELQFEILTQAVNALSQEIARNNQRSEELTEESARLRARVESLRRELASSEGEDDRLRSRAEALEKQLREVGAAVPDASSERPKTDGKLQQIPTPRKEVVGESDQQTLAAAKPSPASPTRDASYHVVAPGENLFRIGVAYGIDYRELASANHINDPALIEVGQRLYIPPHGPR